MNYRVVYDVTNTAPDWWFVAAGLGFVVVAAVVWRRRHRSTGWLWPMRTRPWQRTAVSAWLLGFSILWTTVVTISILGQTIRARRVMAGGSERVVEGVVEDFHPMPEGGYFTVEGVQFSLSDAILRTSFRNTGYPVRDGVFVRIHYVGSADAGEILKLEVRE